MKEYRGNSDSNRQKGRKRPGGHPRYGLLCTFFALCCCLAISAVSYLLNNFPPAAESNRPSAPLSSSIVISTDASPEALDETQDSDGQTAAGAGADNSADDTPWHLILVNRWNPIPEGYEMELTVLAGGQLVDKRIYPALQELFDAARSDGVYPVVVSGYRTAEMQQRLLDEKIAAYRAAGCSAAEARTQGEGWVAIPGTSEHQLGIAVDLNGDGLRSAGYEVYEWLAQNAHKYGFICRYPPDKTEITGVIGEAWHYRYVGIEAAAEIYIQGVCLEEYLNSVN